jgi:hypothetical protein
VAVLVRFHSTSNEKYFNINKLSKTQEVDISIKFNSGIVSRLRHMIGVYRYQKSGMPVLITNRSPLHLVKILWWGALQKKGHNPMGAPLSFS